MQTKQYVKAHEMINKGLEYSRKNHRLADEVQLVNMLFEIQIAEQKYKSASETATQLINLNDSLLSQKKNESIAKLEVKYDTERKTYEAKLAKEELKVKEAKFNRQRALFLIAALAALLFAMIIAFFVWRSRIKEKHNKIVLENKLLRSQINPHFMFNALGAIQAYMIDHTNEDTMQYLYKFSQLMRNILDSSRANTISLAQENAIISDYLSLQQLRFDHRFEYNISIDDALDKTTEIPPMLLQPFVENAVEHGIKSLGEATQGKIDVNFKKQGSNLIMSVKDNGKGFDTTSETGNKNHVSHATNIVRERIKAINSMSKYQISLNIHSIEDKGTEVVIQLHLLY